MEENKPKIVLWGNGRPHKSWIEIYTENIEKETAKKIFDDLAELLIEIRSDARQMREENNELEHSLHFYTGKGVACGEIVGKLSELKKKYKVED